MDEISADLFWEEHNVAQVREGEGKQLEMVEVIGYGDPGAHAMQGIDAEGKVTSPLDHAQTRILCPDVFSIF